MKGYECENCGMEFASEGATGCPKCGSALLSCQGPEIVQPASTVQASEGKEEPLPAVREILEQLSAGIYDCSFKGHDWEMLLEKALEELRPFIQKQEIAA